MTSSPVKK